MPKYLNELTYLPVWLLKRIWFVDGSIPALFPENPYLKPVDTHAQSKICYFCTTQELGSTDIRDNGSIISEISPNLAHYGKKPPANFNSDNIKLAL